MRRGHPRPRPGGGARPYGASLLGSRPGRRCDRRLPDVTPTERRRPVTRRRRLAHLGVGGVIAAAATAHLAAINEPEPVAHAATDPVAVPDDFPIDLPPKPVLVRPRPKPHRASRSHARSETVVIPPEWQKIAECE